MRGLLLLLSLPHVLTALPPLSPERQRDWATAIVRGTVRAQSESLHSPSSGHTDTWYQSTVEVTGVEKGHDSVGDAGSLSVKYWRVKSRPSGMVGPQGQSHIMAVGSAVKLFLREAQSDSQAGSEFHLLTPNGWVLDAEESSVPTHKPPPLRHSRRGTLRGRVIATREVTRQEAPWLSEDVPKGSVLTVFTGQTHGTISRAGIAVRWEGSEDAPFFELPLSALAEYQDEL